MTVAPGEIGSFEFVRGQELLGSGSWALGLFVSQFLGPHPLVWYFFSLVFVVSLVVISLVVISFVVSCLRTVARAHHRSVVGRTHARRRTRARVRDASSARGVRVGEAVPRSWARQWRGRGEARQRRGARQRAQASLVARACGDALRRRTRRAACASSVLCTRGLVCKTQSREKARRQGSRQKSGAHDVVRSRFCVMSRFCVTARFLQIGKYFGC